MGMGLCDWCKISERIDIGFCDSSQISEIFLYQSHVITSV